jgi:hypothetical protein
MPGVEATGGPDSNVSSFMPRAVKTVSISTITCKETRAKVPLSGVVFFFLGNSWRQENVGKTYSFSEPFAILAAQISTYLIHN